MSKIDKIGCVFDRVLRPITYKRDVHVIQGYLFGSFGGDSWGIIFRTILYDTSYTIRVGFIQFTRIESLHD